MLLIFIIITYCLFACYAGLLLGYRQQWIKAGSLKTEEIPASKPTAISVIIPARNEALQLPGLFDSLQQQTYDPAFFEIILADDHSTDATAQVASQYAKQLMQNKGVHCRIISMQEELKGQQINSYKKKSIETAIGYAKGELIVCTDADCTVPPHWLQTIDSYYRLRAPVMIVMPVNIPAKARFIEIFQSLDFMTLQGITGAAVSGNIHSMCNGANLAYRKDAFYQVNGFEGIDDIASGDDMLLMHKIRIAYPNSIAYLKNKDVIVQTTAVAGIRGFIQQRIRWASKANHYEDKSIFPVLLIVYLFNLFILLMVCLAIFDRNKYQISGITYNMVQAGSCLIVLKILVELYFLWPVAGFFNQRKICLYFPLMQPFHIIYTVVAGLLGKTGHYKWKNRKVQ